MLVLLYVYIYILYIIYIYSVYIYYTHTLQQSKVAMENPTIYRWFSHDIYPFIDIYRWFSYDISCDKPTNIFCYEHQYCINIPIQQSFPTNLGLERYIPSLVGYVLSFWSPFGSSFPGAMFWLPSGKHSYGKLKLPFRLMIYLLNMLIFHNISLVEVIPIIFPSYIPIIFPSYFHHITIYVHMSPYMSHHVPSISLRSACWPLRVLTRLGRAMRNWWVAVSCQISLGATQCLGAVGEWVICYGWMRLHDHWLIIHLQIK